MQLCYSVILPLELHCSSIVKKKKKYTNILFICLSHQSHSHLHSLFSFSSFSIHSFNPSPSLVPLFPFKLSSTQWKRNASIHHPLRLSDRHGGAVELEIGVVGFWVRHCRSPIPLPSTLSHPMGQLGQFS